MNNLLSYCGLVDAKIRASDKDLPVKASVLRDPGLFLDQHGPTVFEHKDLNGPSTSIDDLLRGND